MRLPLLLLAAALALPACAGGTPSTPTTPRPSEVRRKANEGAPVATPRPEGVTPYAARLVKTTPSQITVTVDEQENGTVSFSYEPDPPDVRFQLAAGMGTPGFEIRTVEVTWSYTVPGEAPTKLPPEQIPISPTLIPAGGSEQEGVAIPVSVPLNPLAVKARFIDPDKARRIFRADASMRFLLEDGTAVYLVNTTKALVAPIGLVIK